MRIRRWLVILGLVGLGSCDAFDGCDKLQPDSDDRVAREIRDKLAKFGPQTAESNPTKVALGEALKRGRANTLSNDGDVEITDDVCFGNACTALVLYSGREQFKSFDRGAFNVGGAAFWKGVNGRSTPHRRREDDRWGARWFFLPEVGQGPAGGPEGLRDQGTGEGAIKNKVEGQ